MYDWHTNDYIAFFTPLQRLSMKFESAAGSDRQATTKVPMEFTKNPNAAWTHMDSTAKADTAMLVVTEGLEAMGCTTAGIAVQWTATNTLDPVE